VNVAHFKPTQKPKTPDPFELPLNEHFNVSKRNVEVFLNESNSLRVILPFGTRQDFEDAALGPSGWRYPCNVGDRMSMSVIWHNPCLVKDLRDACGRLQNS